MRSTYPESRAFNEDYYIDDKGVYWLESRSYPDAIIAHYVVKFDSEDRETQFAFLVKRLRYDGEAKRAAALKAFLT